MEEKIISGKKNGMFVLLAVLLAYAAAVALLVVSSVSIERQGGSLFTTAGMTVSIAFISLGWILLMGLKVLRPQEALVLTLFGQYVGTLKENGFYFVNPFCVGVNPASQTKLSQSGVGCRGNSGYGKRRPACQGTGGECK